MKYIRTKDKIYDGSLFLREYTGRYFNEKSKLYAFAESEIIKQADTIEELCDRIVICFIDGSKLTTKFECFAKDKLGILSLESFELELKEIVDYFVKKSNETIFKNVYGAVWTDKGLIYVAKMNEKGELELL